MSKRRVLIQAGLKPRSSAVRPPEQLPADYNTGRLRNRKEQQKERHNDHRAGQQPNDPVAHGAAAVKAPLVYHGGKQRLASWISPRLPYRRGYCEPFAGMASVLLARRPSPNEAINDLDRNVYAFWQTVREQTDRQWLQDKLDWSPLSSKEAYDEADEHLTDPELPLRDRAYWWIVKINKSFGGKPDGGYARRYPMCAPNSWPRLEPLAARLKKTEVLHCDAVELLERLAGRPEQTLYVDPPYPGTDVSWYNILPDYERLVKTLLSQKGSVMVSGYEDSWPDLVEAGWQMTATPSILQTMDARVAVRRTEAVFTNYRIPEQGGLF